MAKNHTKGGKGNRIENFVEKRSKEEKKRDPIIRFWPEKREKKGKALKIDQCLRK